MSIAIVTRSETHFTLDEQAIRDNPAQMVYVMKEMLEASRRYPDRPIQLHFRHEEPRRQALKPDFRPITGDVTVRLLPSGEAPRRQKETTTGTRCKVHPRVNSYYQYNTDHTVRERRCLECDQKLFDKVFDIDETPGTSTDPRLADMDAVQKALDNLERIMGKGCTIGPKPGFSITVGAICACKSSKDCNFKGEHECVCGGLSNGNKERPGHSSYCRYREGQK